eukprot:gnl/Spiro4/5643_TR2878_c0_g1_i1.p5 gnl/Spiro4/5643_TR2878_c0_g1~~gnl/Spiro4/5643_TR2878_c0_g1_i1.p5  ORF type:complete len:743 (+),score=-36.20 gnl/Spiro4/5643_TR2878_c0_g1_i1:3108-5336(+)
MSRKRTWLWAQETSPPSPSWLPTDASLNLLVWYRADMGVTEAGGFVTSWADSSGAGDANRNQIATGSIVRHASDPDFGGKPSIELDQSDLQYFLSSGAWSTPPNGPITFIMVVRESTTGLSSFIIDDTNKMLWDNGTAMQAYNGTNAPNSGGFRPYLAPGVVMFTDNVDVNSASGSKLFLNDLGEPKGRSFGRFTSTSSLFNVGFGGFGVGNLQGKFAEIIIYAGDLSAPANTTDRANIVTYLNDRAYGPTVTLTWTPLEDAGVQAGALWLPGDYDDALFNGFALGRWYDSSGNQYHADTQIGTVAASPGGVSEGVGSTFPVFDGSGYLLAAVSPADDVTYPTNHVGTPDNGGMIVIVEQRAALDPFVIGETTYNAMAPISGTGATPQISTVDIETFCSGYDGADYTVGIAPSGIARPNVAHIIAGAWDSIGTYAACDEDTFGSVSAYPGGSSLNVGNIGNTWIGKAFSANYVGVVKAAALYKTKAALDIALPKWRTWAEAHGYVNPNIITVAQTAPDLFVPPGAYLGTAPGTWREAGIIPHNLVGTGGDGPPIDTGGIPECHTPTDHDLTDASLVLTDWLNDGDHSLFVIAEPYSIVGTAEAPADLYVNDSAFGESNAWFGFTFRITGGNYWADYWEYEAGGGGLGGADLIRVASVSLGATIGPGNKFVLQARKMGGFLWIRLNGNPWTMGDICGTTGGGASPGVFSYGGNFNGKVHAAATWKRVLSSGESDAIAAAGAAL